MRQKIVLYNPRAVFYTMPLALLAVGSGFDPDRFDIEIIDGRLEEDPARAVRAALPGATAFGVTVLTGAPIRDALEISRGVKAVRPDLPVVWGGWQPSLFPLETLAEPSIDITVQGQGEVTFQQLVAALSQSDGDLSDVAGICWRREGQPVRNAPRPLAPMSSLPRHRYELLDVGRYFRLKGRRQLDYISSTGCPFRCAFCADPFVYERRWTAVSPERMVAEIADLQACYHFDEVAFQDETFFTYRDRIAELASGLLERGVSVEWTATLRADQGERLTEEVFELCVRAGLRRVMIGVESASADLLRWMQKDTTVEQVLASAAMCVRHGVGAIFPFIVGFPGESDESVRQTMALAKRLRSMSPRFDTPIFFFKPYPGSRITQEVVAAGYRLPETLEGWADFDFVGSSGPWVSAEKSRLIERFKFYNRLAGGPETWLRRPLQALARWRCRKDWYAVPIEQAVVDRLRPQPRLS